MSLLDHMMLRFATGLIYLARISPKEIIIRLVNRRYTKKVLANRKKLDSIDDAKYNFDDKTKIFVNQDLCPANESIAYNCRKLRRAEIIDCCYSRDGIISIKNTVNSKPEKIHHMKELRDLFPDFTFSNDEESIPHTKYDVVNESSNSGTVWWVH